LAFVIPSILIPVVLIISANFIITSKQISALQYELLTDNVSYVLEKTESDYATIDALGMAEVEFYRQATQKGILQDVGKHLSPGTSTVIIDKNSHEILLSNGNTAKALSLDADLVEKMLFGIDGTIDYEFTLGSGEKIDVLATFGEFPSWNWMIVSFIDKNQLFSYIYNAMVFSFTVAGIFLLITFIMVFKLADGISRSIVALKIGAEKLSRNEPDVRVEGHGGAEFHSLANSFNSMAAEIRKSHEQLQNSASNEKTLRLDLQESEERHRTIFQTATEGYLLIDAQARILEANDAYCNMSLYSYQELIGMHLTELEAPIANNVNDTNANDIVLIEQGHNESRHKRKNGSLYTVETSTKTLPLRDGCSAIFVRNIEERKTAELKLVESQRQYYEVVEGTRDLITRVDNRGFITFVNHASNKIYGLPPAECVGKNAFSFIHEDDLERTQTEFSRWLQGGGDYFSFENRQVSVDGHEFQMDWSIRPEYDTNNEINGFVSFARDISDSRLLEKERSKLQSQLQQAQKMEAVGQLAGGVAHDFNNMLGVIIGHAELALAKLGPSDSVIANIEEILRAANHSSELTKQLLTFARKQPIKPTVVDLNDSVADILAMLKRLIGENINLSFQPNPELWQVNVDPAQIDQIIANLCLNAKDAISGPGKITISLANDQHFSDGEKKHFDYPEGEYVQLSVTDDGKGIDSTVLSRIFEPFFTTKELGDGTGLGLATVFGAVKQNNGFIHVQSEPDEGSTFSVYIPRSATDRVELRNNSEKVLHHGTETVLIVEDDKMLLDMETTMLKQSGYNVLSAGTPELAQKIVKEHSGLIHLLLTDVVMPEMNGKDLSDKLLAILPDMGVLYMSGYPADIIASEKIIDGTINFLQKPFSMQVLTDKVREVLNSKKPRPTG